MKEFETVIGLEVHVQLKTQAKIFCGCSTAFESAPNSNICPVCCGYPGVLPVFNQRALELAIRVSLALQCRINPRIYFERKHYFYPDLPKDYQISQYKLPLGEEGALLITSGKKIGITRVHLEEDAGKLIHEKEHSLVDFNRTGIPLLEIVSCPDIASPQEAHDYLTYLKLTLQYIGASDCDMEKGYLRCDANISLREKGVKELGTKVELKNMNSFSGVRDALAFEAKRQEKTLKEGKKIVQETRLWDVDQHKTVVMRTKEEAHDYRYFPEPDLLDFSVPEEFVEEERRHVGELPLLTQQRFQKEYVLTAVDAHILVSTKWLAQFFEEACRNSSEHERIAKWLLGPFMEQVNLLPAGFAAVKISPKNFAKVVQLFCDGTLNSLAAKKVLELAITTDKDIDEIVNEQGLTQVSGIDELTVFVKEALEANEKAVAEYRAGKQQVIMFLVGQVMRKTKGKANPTVVRELLEKALEA